MLEVDQNLFNFTNNWNTKVPMLLFLPYFDAYLSCTDLTKYGVSNKNV